MHRKLGRPIREASHLDEDHDADVLQLSRVPGGGTVNLLPR